MALSYFYNLTLLIRRSGFRVWTSTHLPPFSRSQKVAGTMQALLGGDEVYHYHSKVNTFSNLGRCNRGHCNSPKINHQKLLLFGPIFEANLIQFASPMMCISTSFGCCTHPRAGRTTFFSAAFNLFCSFQTFFSDFTAEIKKNCPNLHHS